MEKPDIAIIYPSSFAENFGETVTSDITDERLNLLIKRQKPQVYNSMEWAIPGIIAAYILKPYFESFLKEAGKDHYDMLKKCLSKLLKKGKSYSNAGFTPKDNTQSKAISIHIELRDGRKIKLLFDNQLEFEDWSNAIEKILDKVLNHYEEYPQDELTLKLEPLEKDPRFQLYAKIDKETKEWDFLDVHELREEAMKKSI